MRTWSSLGFTLIELLAVIVIATLVMSIGMVSIGNVEQQTAVVSLVGGVRSMDARARLHARTSGGCVEIRVDSQARLIRMVAVASDGEFLLATHEIPSTIGLEIDTAHGDGVVAFDLLGISEDYTLVVHGPDSSKRLSIAGLTGEVRMAEHEGGHSP